MSEQDKYGWIEWAGGKCPVEHGTLVDVKFRDGEMSIGAAALSSSSPKVGKYLAMEWNYCGGGRSDIIAYRLHNQPAPTKIEATTQQIGGDHYKKYGDMQPINILQKYLTPEEFRGYTKGTAIVYLLREGDKNCDEDIAKARHHIQLWEELKGGAE